MKYRVKEGVALFQMCGSWFLFPSRSSGKQMPFILFIPVEMVPVLTDDKSAEYLGQEAEEKLLRLVRAGYIEEWK